MKDHDDDDKARVNIQKKESGWKLDIWFWGFNTIHVFATRKGKKRSWNFNRIYKLVEGVWRDEDFKDKWSIRYDRPYPGAPESHWPKLYSPPGSMRVAERIRGMVVRVANKKKAARWRAEGFYRSRERRRALENYFSSRKSLDRANELVNKTKKTYEAALALEKAFRPTR